ncbi:MAG: hypothetical protein A2W91_18590 [Bacteroidetes bacterium GWF2_38_335]|nr:MAG: hypothetical protein A2W91_18590 [Bacteroidetes bacterium GWF2_38_335]OFY78187.1 MAG: hypothetical protein A2281_04475 [Bacteroidetes bacterium RIFOXYA12_FULL_38_20]HBS88650.1 hypothetical protein [Bacteroidales bacterium]
MKQISFLAVLLFAVIFGNAQDAVKKTNEKSEKKTSVIVFEKTVYNYGTIAKGSEGTCEFIFKNAGKDPIVLQNVKATCGCTTPKWSKEPILKGEKGSIKVRYDTSKTGKFSKTISVYSNAKNSEVELRVEGTVVDEPEKEQKTEDSNKQPKKQ